MIIRFIELTWAQTKYAVTAINDTYQKKHLMFNSCYKMREVNPIIDVSYSNYSRNPILYCRYNTKVVIIVSSDRQCRIYIY